MTTSNADTRIRIRALARSPGLWLMLAGIEILLLVHLAEMMYPGYSISEDYISDLGIGPARPAVVFTTAVILFGLMALGAAVILRQNDRRSRLWLFLALSGIGAILVGLFNEDYTLVHRPAALIAFLFGNLAALYSYKLSRPPLSYVSAFLGLLGLVALALFGSGVYLGLGVGGMERMILYPAMFWAMGYGAYLCAEDSRSLAAGSG